MFKNYLKIAVRNLLRHKGYSLINILGLAIGMACCILILLYVQDELSYDRYHKNAERIYRIADELHIGGKTVYTALTPVPMAPALINEYPEVVSAVRFFRHLWQKPLINYGDRHFYENRFFFADSTVFNIFSFPLVEGNPRTALKEPYSVVITREIAKKYFGDEDPIGKVLNIQFGNEKIDFKVTGVLENIPYNSHFRFDFLGSFVTLESQRGLPQQWVNHVFYTYILVSKNYPPAELERQFPHFINKYAGKQLEAVGMKVIPHLQPLTSIHLHSHLEYEIEPNSDVTYVYIFSVIALFILLIASINFMNLSTARSVTRAKEVGIRKVVGADRLQLIRQFLGETVLLSFVALLLAIALVELFLPAFNDLSNKKLIMNYGGNLPMLLKLLGIAVLVGIISGSYPAFFLSAFHPVDVLKGTLRAGSGSSPLRRVLVVLQFAIAVVLIIGTNIVYNQLNYIRNKPLGFQKEHVIVFPNIDRNTWGNYDAIKSRLLEDSNMLSVAASSSLPGAVIGQNFIRPEGARYESPVYTLSVDEEFMGTLGIKLVAGRNFSKQFGTDMAKAMILNETAVKRLGWESPKEAIGKHCTLWGKKRTIIGVVKDFHFRSLHYKIEPLVFLIEPDNFSYISVRVRPGNIPITLAFLKNIWHEFVPNRPFQYFFLDDSVDKLYKAEHKLGKIFGSFSLLAIFIACLGLFGLASFATEQRTKEIGIRKALGASVSSIVFLLTKEFTKLVLIANLIAWPIAYFAMSRWLQNFAYRIDIGLGSFLLAGAIALVIALLTVSFQAVKAALANPVDALRYE